MKVAKFLFILITVFVLVVIVMNQSISSYIEQRYHFSFYPQNTILKEGNKLKTKLEQIHTVLSTENTPKVAYANYQVIKDISEEDTNLSNNPETKEQPQQEQNLSSFEEQNTTILTDDDTKLIVDPSKEFLFMGDSLMQGVAMNLNKNLSNLGIKTEDLSKQNTGLSYKSYFNWAKTIENAFLTNSNIKYLVVLLGPNDPWDIRKGKNYLRFGTPAWKEIYTARVDEIIQIAQKYKVKILWFEVPPVKKDSLNDKIQILNEIYRQEVLKNKEIFIDTKSSFSFNDRYSTYIKNENNKTIKVRTDDGIHFTMSGAKIMSKLLLKHLIIKDQNVSK
ncbi:DUF459 domain-containing protein [Campylobacter sp. B0100352/1]|uniref:SGNH/GDSL hydrolase family protein n=1 Tax=unclassified Campylobacter TaxID=2593542 RepID=UPI001D8B8373|nr:DUF459 domain-containing protein [Campylobacter sp. B0100352/1]MBZ7964779.1 DUF459 domain-containing protein [Campylobacter sp. 2457A]